MLDLINFSNVLENRKVDAESLEDRRNDSIVYLFLCFFDNLSANEIDFSRISLDDITTAMEVLEWGYDHEEDLYVFAADHPLTLANNYSEFEYFHSELFSKIATKRRKHTHRFI